MRRPLETQTAEPFGRIRRQQASFTNLPVLSIPFENDEKVESQRSKESKFLIVKTEISPKKRQVIRKSSSQKVIPQPQKIQSKPLPIKKSLKLNLNSKSQAVRKSIVTSSTCSELSLPDAKEKLFSLHFAEMNLIMPKNRQPFGKHNAHHLDQALIAVRDQKRKDIIQNMENKIEELLRERKHTELLMKQNIINSIL